MDPSPGSPNAYPYDPPDTATGSNNRPFLQTRVTGPAASVFSQAAKTQQEAEASRKRDQHDLQHRGCPGRRERQTPCTGRTRAATANSALSSPAIRIGFIGSSYSVPPLSFPVGRKRGRTVSIKMGIISRQCKSYSLFPRPVVLSAPAGYLRPKLRKPSVSRNRAAVRRRARRRGSPP